MGTQAMVTGRDRLAERIAARVAETDRRRDARDARVRARREAEATAYWERRASPRMAGERRFDRFVEKNRRHLLSIRYLVNATGLPVRRLLEATKRAGLKHLDFGRDEKGRRFVCFYQAELNRWLGRASRRRRAA